MEWLKKSWVKLGIRISGFLFLIGATAFTIAYFTTDIPDPNEYVNSQATIIQFSDGDEVGRIGAQNRTIIPLAGVPQDLRRAVLAAEDKGFYSQGAFNPLAILRGAINTALGRGLQGGSTITQQYAKTAFLTPDRTIQRKIIELIVAIKLENQLSKDQIFENYLNTIYFGRGAYGVETGAKVYFGKSANQLTIPQAAVLAAILRSPGYYDPEYREGNKERLEARYKYVLNNMASEGWLERELADKYLKKVPEIRPRLSTGQLAGNKGHLIEAVKKELNSLGFTEEELMVGGLIVRTTLEKDPQTAAETAVFKQSPANAPDDLRIGLVSIRPGTGEIVAMYGGKDYLERQLNDATQGITQAGSTFKPFALVAALEQGISLASIWNGDGPKIFDDFLGRPYEVSNYGNKSFGDVSLLNASAVSINTIYVPLGIKIGVDKVIDAARRAGIPENVAMVPSPSVVLGVASPRVIDVANSFATFAANGIKAKPFLVKEVLGPNKGILYQARIETEQVFDESVMADLNYALGEVVRAGTASSALRGFGRPAAGKTGTSQSNASAWFTGYTPQLATSVAFFRDDATESLNGIGGLNSVTGGSFPARIWNAYMKAALKGQPKLDFPAPTFIGGVEPFPIPDPVATIAPSDAAAWCSTADLEGAMKDLKEFCTKALKKYLIVTPKD
ncbi:MAG: penicillin-binding protein [Actinobacteria bacterium]|nr:penicillin-binding protein [Actinomycetota bacterium]NBP22527.1 penicillin-binding protein [Actinomycetota bacterium]NBQ66832.1 penicillin-binding protein [Actinomycetota bacterium]NBY50209.1 penicillin-binding protein [Actinomycetota bacterium]NDD07800.1 penicillin-binding protein [Actinomycetota bacterium]